ncbi:P-loop containing nucleoside triphosphate hydrolase protein [Lichtheimia hyalospora FSU 10163]|nr:P-loop containing nucleoside triphosphate hydrolase protein [Lichtheimia hyalospora FSU 10163]
MAVNTVISSSPTSMKPPSTTTIASSSSSNQHVNNTILQVALRIRPISQHDDTNINIDGRLVTIQGSSFVFDQVFGSDSTQDQMFRSVVSGLVDRFIDGYNSILVTQGEPGSGKTYTLGYGSNVDDGAELEGVIPRATTALFERLYRHQNASAGHRPATSFTSSFRLSSTNNSRLLRPASMTSLIPRRGSTPNLSSKAPRYTIRVSHVALENDQLLDLLSHQKGQSVTVHDRYQDEMGISQVLVRNTGDVLRYLESSSQQHKAQPTVFTITLRQEKWVRVKKPIRVTPSKSTPIEHSVSLHAKRRPISSTLNVKAMVGQMEMQARHQHFAKTEEEQPGEWVVTQQKMHFVEHELDINNMHPILVQFLQPQQQQQSMKQRVAMISCINPSSDHALEAIESACRARYTANPLVQPSSKDDDDKIARLKSQLDMMDMDVESNNDDQDTQDELFRLSNQLAVAQERQRIMKAAAAVERQQPPLPTPSSSLEHPKEEESTTLLAHKITKALEQGKPMEHAIATKLIESIKQHSGISDEHEQRMQELESLAEQRHVQLQAMQKKMAAQSTSLDEAREQNRELRRHMWDQEKGTQVTLRHRLEELERVKRQLDALQSVATTQDTMLGCLGGKLDGMNQTIHIVKQQVADRDNIIESLESENKTKQKLLDDARITIDRLQRHMRRERVEIARMIEAVDSEVRLHGNRMDRTAEALVDLQHLSQQQARMLDDRQAQIAELEDMLRRAKEESRHEVDVELQRTKALESRVAELDEQLSRALTLQENRDGDQNDDNEIRHIIEGLQARLQTLQQTQQQDQDALQARYERAVKDLEHSQEFNRKQQAAIDGLQKQLDEQQESSQPTEAVVDEEELMQLMEGDPKALVQRCKQLMHDNQQLAENVNDLEGQLLLQRNKLSLEQKNLELQVMRLSSANSRLEKEVEQRHRASTSSTLSHQHHMSPPTSPRMQSPIHRDSLLSATRERASALVLPPPSAPPSNPLPPVPSALPPIPSAPSSPTPSTSHPLIPNSPPMHLQRHNSATTISTLDGAEKTSERYERIIRSLQRKIKTADGDVKAHQDVIVRLEQQLSRSEQSHVNISNR